MKRKLLEKKTPNGRMLFKREGANHSLWLNPNTGHIEAIPRHAEVKELLVKKNPT